MKHIKPADTVEHSDGTVHERGCAGWPVGQPPCACYHDIEEYIALCQSDDAELASLADE